MEVLRLLQVVSFIYSLPIFFNTGFFVCKYLTYSVCLLLRAVWRNKFILFGVFRRKWNLCIWYKRYIGKWENAHFNGFLYISICQYSTSININRQQRVLAWRESDELFNCFLVCETTSGDASGPMMIKLKNVNENSTIFRSTHDSIKFKLPKI